MAKLLIEARHVLKTYGMRTVLDIDDFELYDGERVGLVGENGAGKSTFIKILSGEIEPDEGFIARHAPISAIAQMGAEVAGDIDPAMVSEFAVEDARPGLSGGEKTRRRIAGALSGRGHVLLADEPTTDLDAKGVKRLEKRLKEYDGAILLISHDRALLDSICTRIIHLEDGKITSFPGNYSAYREELARRREFQQFRYDQYRAEQKRIMGMIQDKVEMASGMHLPTRMGNSEARLHKRSVSASQAGVAKIRKTYESRLERLEEVERPREDPSIAMKLGAATPVTSRTCVEIRNIFVRAGSKSLLENASMRLPTGSRTALIGDNGCGKSTLISRITRPMGNPAVRLSPGVKAGWFDQEHENTLDPDKTAVENVMYSSVHPESTVRTILARLNMRGDEALKPVRVLSGGERAKVALAKLFASDINLLILDEPTNHLDIFTLEALQEVLKEYAGTMLIVSHDRAFVKEIAQRLVFFENKNLTTYEGDMISYENSLNRDRSKENIELERTRLQMRMATLAARMSAPKKGDDPLKLNEEYEALIREINNLPKV